MLLTRIVLRPSETSRRLSAAEVIDLLWINCTESDGIKHIHAREIADSIHVVAFTVASEQSISDYIVRCICERAVRTVPAFDGWIVYY